MQVIQYTLATRISLAVTFACLLVNCASFPENSAMRLDVYDVREGSPLLWPEPPLLPYFLYLGELQGEQNFRSGNQQLRSGLNQAFDWIIGIGRRDNEVSPTVLQRPQSGVVDKSGRIYVTDVSRRAVFVFDEQGARLLIWDRATKQLSFRSPIGIALDGAGGVLVTDSELGGVFRLSATGEPIGVFGQDVLTRPTGITRDPDMGLIYVADTHANDIKVFDDNGLLVDFIGHSGESPGQLNSPTHITFAHGRLYVTDTLNSRVQVFDRDGNLTKVFGERGLYVGNLARPKGIAVDSQENIYVIEGYYDYLLVYDKDGQLLLPIGGTGSQPGQFYLPTGVWTDDNGRVFVADMFNGRVSIFQFLGGS